MKMKKNIILLGATGNIGQMTIDIIKKYSECYNLLGISVGKNLDLAVKIINEFDLEIVSFIKEEDYLYVKKNTKKEFIKKIGEKGLEEIVIYKEATIVNALQGFVGLKPTINAIKNKRDICLANKETLVVAGKIIMDLAKENNVKIIPIDSEHSAIFQLLLGEKKEEVEEIIITSSGGAFRDINDYKEMTLENALKHPNWSMGKKITIDSATMMNKFFEILEAHYLFDFPLDKIKAIIHYESLVHGILKFKDGNKKMLFAPCDMKIPISYALSYPNRKKYDINKENELKNLSFKEIDLEKYPCFKLALASFKEGNEGAIINASNEAAVKLFLEGKINYLDIYNIIKYSINKFPYQENPTLEEIYQINDEVYSHILMNYGGIIK